LEAERAAAGDKMDQSTQATNTVIERLTGELAKKDASATADDFTKHVKEEMDKINPAN
jgi:hypothetical protein